MLSCIYREEGGQRVPHRGGKKAEHIFENQTKAQKLGTCQRMGKGQCGWVVKAVGKADMRSPKDKRVWWFGGPQGAYYGMSSIRDMGNSGRYGWRNN